MNQTYNKKFHCTYLLHYYPFDTQVIFPNEKKVVILNLSSNLCVQICAVDLQLQQFAQVNVELVPDNIALLTDTELTQYYIQAWSLDYNVQGTTTILK